MIRLVRTLNYYRLFGIETLFKYPLFNRLSHPKNAIIIGSFTELLLVVDMFYRPEFNGSGKKGKHKMVVG